MSAGMIVLVVVLAVVFVILAALLYMVKPNSHRDVSQFRGENYAHRGLHGGIVDKSVPENSMAAFAAAKKEGYGVELDVQYTKDGQIVVFHDGDLKRLCGIDGKVADYTYEELKNFRLYDTEERIPLFSDVLKLLEDRPLVCEIKNHNGNKNDKLCLETYKMLETYGGPYCVESFSPFLMRWFKVHHPEVIRGQLSCDMMKTKELNFPSRVLMSHLLCNVFSRPDFLAYRHQDANVLGFKLCRALYKPFLVAWTARGKAEQNSAWKVFDSVIFETYENPNPVE